MDFFRIILLLACSSCPLHAPLAQAADPAREGEVAAQLSGALKTGRVVWLESAGGKFMGIVTEASTPQRLGAVVLLHDLEGHPDWPRVISPLRRALPEAGWQTLSIQLPLLSPDTPLDARTLRAIHDEGLGRVKTAIEHLAAQGVDTIALAGHGMGATVMSAYLAGEVPENHAAALKSLVMIRPRHAPDLPPEYQPQHLLARTALPVLDIVSGQQQPQAQSDAKLRKAAAAGAGNVRYRQLALPWPDNDFAGTEALLTSRIGGWLKRQAADTQAEESKTAKENTKPAD